MWWRTTNKSRCLCLQVLESKKRRVVTSVCVKEKYTKILQAQNMFSHVIWETSFEKIFTRFWYQESCVMSICAITGGLFLCFSTWLSLFSSQATWNWPNSLLFEVLCFLTKFTGWDLHYALFSNSLLKHKAMLAFINFINLLINLGSCFNSLVLPSVSAYSNFNSIFTGPLWEDRQRGLMSTLQMVSWVTESRKFPPIFDARKALFCGVFNIMLNIIPWCLT